MSDRAVPAPLFAEEEDATARALDRRRREFALGRTCARRALQRLGAAPAPIPARDRAPVWPEGIVGAITHTHGLVIAAVAWRSHLAGIGVDAEVRQRPLARRLASYVCTPAEAARLRGLGVPADDALRVLFSAKEAVHKCIAPMSGVTLGFRDVELEIDAATCRFRVRLVGRSDTRLPDLRRLRGRFALTPRFVVASAVIPDVRSDCGGHATDDPGAADERVM